MKNEFIIFTFMNHTAWVYIVCNKRKTTVYTGVTTDIRTRMWEHRTKRDPGSFTARYNAHCLVYYQGFETLIEAVAREKYIKGKSRKWKEQLIESINPEWRDLTHEVDPFFIS